MSIKPEDVAKLRSMTGAGMMSAKNALTEAGGDIEKAVELLRISGQASARNRADYPAANGMIESYVHNGKIGVLVEVNCETDFVARTDDFKEFAHDIAMQVAATAPEYISPEMIPEQIVEKEKELFRSELAGSEGTEATDQMVQQKLDQYYRTVCLTQQPLIKDPNHRVADLLADLVGKVGENIVIRRFERFELGGGDG